VKEKSGGGLADLEVCKIFFNLKKSRLRRMIKNNFRQRRSYVYIVFHIILHPTQVINRVQ